MRVISPHKNEGQMKLTITIAKSPVGIKLMYLCSYVCNGGGNTYISTYIHNSTSQQHWSKFCPFGLFGPVKTVATWNFDRHFWVQKWSPGPFGPAKTMLKWAPPPKTKWSYVMYLCTYVCYCRGYIHKYIHIHSSTSQRLWSNFCPLDHLALKRGRNSRERFVHPRPTWSPWNNHGLQRHPEVVMSCITTAFGFFPSVAQRVLRQT